jgi:DNA-binding transcriptional LysR family regulator
LDRFTGMTVFVKVVDAGFVKVVDAGSFAAAARHFRMSAAMVSKHLQTLEEHLGAQLLNRAV